MAALSEPAPTPAERERVLALLTERSGIDLGRARVRAGFTRGHLIDVVVYVGAGDERARAIAVQATEALLGPALTNRWIGEVLALPLPASGPLPIVRPEMERTFPLDELPQAVLAAIEGLMCGLPAEPLYRSEHENGWTLFDLEPVLAVDYAEQDDLILCSTLLPELTKAYLQGLPIDSGRFSKHGEIFCYLKIDDGDALGVARLAQRTAVANELDAHLVESRTGCVIGEGMGLRYSYLSLALVDQNRGEKLACETARACGVSPRAWLLFYDRAQQREWRGVWKDTPPPPFA